MIGSKGEAGVPTPYWIAATGLRTTSYIELEHYILFHSCTGFPSRACPRLCDLVQVIPVESPNQPDQAYKKTFGTWYIKHHTLKHPRPQSDLHTFLRFNLTSDLNKTLLCRR